MDAVRCPYCIEGEGFRAMTPHDDYFACETCGHQVASDRPNFRCSCAKCEVYNSKSVQL